MWKSISTIFLCLGMEVSRLKLLPVSCPKTNHHTTRNFWATLTQKWAKKDQGGRCPKAQYLMIRYFLRQKASFCHQSRFANNRKWANTLRIGLVNFNHKFTSYYGQFFICLVCKRTHLLWTDVWRLEWNCVNDFLSTCKREPWFSPFHLSFMK